MGTFRIQILKNPKKKKDLEAVLDNTMEIEKLCNFKQRELILLIALYLLPYPFILRGRNFGWMAD